LTETLNLIAGLEIKDNGTQYKKRLKDLLLKLVRESSLTTSSDINIELKDKTLYTGLYYLSQK
jgi:hypothetical protein